MNVAGTATGALIARARRLGSAPFRERAAWVAGAWALVVLPMALGWQRCPIAVLVHEPCPGCGLTRALRLLWDGEGQASLQMHPLAVPILASGTMFVVSTVWATLVLGSPFGLFRTRLGWCTAAVAVVVYVAAVTLWGLRWFGFCGGPVPV